MFNFLTHVTHGLGRAVLNFEFLGIAAFNETLHDNCKVYLYTLEWN